jgi:cysteinyl-tRNA synthetase
MIKDQKIYRNNKHSLLLDFDKVLGLGLQKRNFAQIPEEVEHLLQERDMARADKDFAKSDELRKKIEDLGFEVKDTAEGSRVAPK